MRLISWNVNGLRSCAQKGLPDFVAGANADVICFQETKLQPEQNSFEPEGYIRWFNSAEKKGYSGTAIFSKTEPMSVDFGIGIPELDNEGRVITAEYPKFFLVTCYTPNAQRDLARLPFRMVWEDAFRGYVSGLAKKKPVAICGDLKETHPSCISTSRRKPVIICGDLNVAATALDIKNPKSNEGNAGFTPEEREKFRALLDAGFVDTFRYMHPDKQEFSWWSYMRQARERNIGWRIDYFLISEFAKSRIVDAQILTDVHGSDHAPVLLDIDI